MLLSETQVHELAKSLVGIITNYYKEAENEERFQKWLRDETNRSVKKGGQR